MTRPTVAVFRPDDERAANAISLLDELGVEPLSDPMLAIEATGNQPRTDADYTILTSKTGVELLDADWQPGGTLCAIGETTAGQLREAGYDVDIVPEEYTSSGLVDRLAAEVDGARVEVARSDHGSDVLLDGLEGAGAFVHETILYRLTRPAGAGRAAELAAAGDLDAVLFTSTLTVENFLDAATERGLREATIEELNDAVVGAIGPPTAETARERGIEVDLVPDTADFEVLARRAVGLLER
ncbi:uroporphyrinogen-III synthase [Halobacteriaceae bacterium SHR40]|uniref:uroporphyrinogen-III synthase n=1 Tax=Halovenus amylolytica TaxID=2500550 RepID=UPI000FE3147D